MILTILLAVLIAGSPPDGPDEFYCITGTLTDPDGRPLVGATVMVAGTSLGAMTGLSGEYLIPHIPVSCVNIQGRMVGMGDSNQCVCPIPGDTVVLDLTLWALGTRIPVFEDRLIEEDFLDTLEVTIVNWRDLMPGVSQAWYNELVLPSWLTSDSTLAVASPIRTEAFDLQVFPAPPVSVYKPDDKRYVSITIPLNGRRPGERYDPGLEPTHEFIDMTVWGNSKLRNWGLLGAEITYSESGRPRMLLVYCEQAVLIDELGDTTVVEFPFPTFNYRADSGLNYLLIWDIYGRNTISGDAAIVSLESGSISVFDPTPDVDESSDEGFYGGAGCTVITTSDRIGPPNKFHVTSTGRVLWLGGEYFHSFNRYGSLICTFSLEDLGPRYFHYGDQFLCRDETTLAAVITDDSLNYCMTIDLWGNILNLSSIPISSIMGSSNCNSPSDPTTGVIWKPLSRSGIARINCFSGECECRSGISVNNACSSRNHQILGVEVFGGSPGFTTYELWNWNTSERISSFSNSDYAYLESAPRLLAISNGGYCLFIQNSRSTSTRTFLVTDDEGILFWKFSDLPYNSPVEFVSAFSQEGNTITFTMGKYLVHTMLGGDFP